MSYCFIQVPSGNFRLGNTWIRYNAYSGTVSMALEESADFSLIFKLDPAICNYLVFLGVSPGEAA